jgi:hypothetical protein
MWLSAADGFASWHRTTSFGGPKDFNRIHVGLNLTVCSAADAMPKGEWAAAVITIFLTGHEGGKWT